MLQSRHRLYAHGSTSWVERRHSPRCIGATGLYRRFREPTVVRVLFPHLWQIGYTANDNVHVWADEPDERYKKEQWFRCPERARISWGKAMQGRGPGEGPSLVALGALL